MALKVGELFADAKINTSGFKAGIAGMLTQVKKFKGKALLAFGAVGAAVGGTVASSVKEFSDYSDILTTATTKTTRAKKGTKEYARVHDKLDKKFKSLGKTTRFTMEQIAGAGVALGQTGYNAEETTTALSGVVDVASASGEDLPVVAKRLTNVAKGYGMQANQLGRLGDIFAEASRSSNTTVSELSEAMKYFAPIGDAMGWSIEKSTALIGVLGDMGIASGQAGRQFKSVVTDWSKMKAGMELPKKKAAIMQKVASSIGMSFTDMRKKISSGEMGLMDFLKTMGKSKHPVGELASLFTKLASAPLTKLATEGGKSWKELTKILEESHGVASEVARAKEDTLAGQTDILRGSISKLKVAIGEKLGGTIKDFMQNTLTPLVNKFSDWVEKTDSLRDAFKDLNKYIPGISDAFEKTKTSLTWMVNHGDATTKIIEAIGIAFGTWKLAALVGPLAAIVSSVAALSTYELYKFMKGVKSGADTAQSMLGLDENIRHTAAGAKTFATRLNSTIKRLQELKEEGYELSDQEQSVLDFLLAFKETHDIHAVISDTTKGLNKETKAINENTKAAKENAKAKTKTKMPYPNIYSGIVHDVSGTYSPISTGKIHENAEGWINAIMDTIDSVMHRANLKIGTTKILPAGLTEGVDYLKYLFPKLKGQIKPNLTTKQTYDVKILEGASIDEKIEPDLSELARRLQAEFNDWRRGQGATP